MGELFILSSKFLKAGKSLAVTKIEALELGKYPKPVRVLVNLLHPFFIPPDFICSKGGLARIVEYSKSQPHFVRISPTPLQGTLKRTWFFPDLSSLELSKTSCNAGTPCRQSGGGTVSSNKLLGIASRSISTVGDSGLNVPLQSIPKPAQTSAHLFPGRLGRQVDLIQLDKTPWRKVFLILEGHHLHSI